jgi:hypothetical protein
MDYQDLAKQFVANADPICFTLTLIFLVYLTWRFVVRHVVKAAFLVFLAYCVYEFLVKYMP